MNLFEEEFTGLLPEVAEALKRRLENTVRQIENRYLHSLGDPKTQNFSGEQLSSMIHSIFQLARDLRSISE